ncbi:MAG TPA: response regulator [Gemmatimonadales bacterium]|nr:response regulator [Gemmatimonadales bacterium]
MGSLVLIIEDDPAQRRLLEKMLDASGYRVLTAPDGESGVATAIGRRPDLIVCDVMMPKLNGYQTVRALKSDPATSAIPVIMLTTKDQPADAFWAGEVGADLFMHKPVDLPRLLEQIARFTGHQ